MDHLLRLDVLNEAFVGTSVNGAFQLLELA